MIKKYLFKLVKGQIPLKITFWVWFILVTLILEYFITPNFNLDNSLTLIYFALILVYTFFIFIAIFKSANRFEGSKIWGYLAKIAITINLFFNITFFMDNFESHYLEDYSINKEIEYFKENLPITVDSNTQLVDINKNDKIISYVYKFLRFDSLDQRAKRKLKKQVQNSLCEADSTLEILKKDYILNYKYINKDENNLITIITDKTACGESIYDLDILKEILRQQGEL